MILTQDSAIEILEAETAMENNPTKIFNSIRKKCMTENDTIINLLKIKHNIKFNLKEI